MLNEDIREVSACESPQPFGGSSKPRNPPPQWTGGLCMVVSIGTLGILHSMHGLGFCMLCWSSGRGE